MPDGQVGGLGHDDRALLARVQRDPAGRLGQRLLDDGHAGRHVAALAEVVEGGRDVHERGAAAGDDAFLDRGARRGDGVLKAVLLLLELDLGGRARAEHAHAAGQLGQPFLQLLAVPVGVRRLDLGLDLTDPLLDRGLVAGAVHDRGVVLGDHDAPGGAEAVEADRLQLDAEVFGHERRAGEGRNVGEHGLAAVAEARRLHRGDVQQAADLVDDDGGQGLAFDVLSDDEQRLLGLRDLLEQRQEVRHRGDLGLVHEDVSVLEHGLEPLLVGDEVLRDVALVELETLSELQLEAHRRRLLDGDHTVLADLVERLGDQLADLGVLRGDRRDVRDLLLLGDLAGGLEQLFRNRGGGSVDAALEVHRVGAGGHRAKPEVDHRLGEHGRGGGAVTGDVVGLGGDFLGELGAEVLVRVLELHLLGDGHTVVGDGGRAPLLVDDDVAAARAKRHLHGVGEPVDATLKVAAGVLVELQDFGH